MLKTTISTIYRNPIFVKNVMESRAIYTVSGRERGMSEAHKSALIILAPDGVEESEAIITGDVMTRGGMQVVYAGLDDEKCPETGVAKPVNCAKGAKLMPTATLKDAVKQDKYDIIVIPGGPGSNTIAENQCVGKLLKKQVDEGGMIGAICAGPVALMSHGIKADNVTAHYSVAEKMKKGGYKVSMDRVVVSGNGKVVTSQGPGTAFEFGLKIVELLVGAQKSKELIKPLCLMI